jgi:flagellar hook-associated protein 2
MSTVNFGGLATGLDTGTIIEQLVLIRRQPILRLESQKQLFERQRAALTDFKAKLTKLQDAAKALDTPQHFGSLKAASTDESILTATAGTEAQQGTYTVVVNALAAAQKDISQGFTSQVAEVGTGTFTITVGGEITEITLGEGDSSLSALKDAINDAGAGVRATIINDGTETTPYRLVLTAEETGEDAAFSVDFSGLTGGTAPALTNVTQAADASLTIDTIPVVSASNTVAGAIEGLTLSLLNLDAGTSVTVTVNTDPAAIAGKVQAFVDAYNDLMTWIDGQQQKGATLQGTSVVRSIESRLASLASGPLAGAANAYRLLAQVGVRQAEGGVLSFDQAEFEAALDADYNAVRDLFVERGAIQGKALLFREAIADLTDTTDGVFKITDDALADKMEQIDDRVERLERGIDSYRSVLQRQFTAMEMLVSGLQAQSGYLSGQFGIYR